MGRLACVLALLCVGCFRLPDVPKPPTPEPDVVLDGTAAGVGKQYEADFRDSCRIAASKLRAGVWKTDREYLEGHRELQRIALEHSGRGFAARQQLEATPFDPDRMADWLEMVAKEGLPE
jgi:hypothetical protein